MRTLAEQAAEELADAPALEIIRWAAATFGERLCLTSSMTDALMIHLASRVQPGIDVLFLDTGYHFAETIGTRDAVEAGLTGEVINVTPSRTVREQDAALGPPPVRAQPRPVLLSAQGRAAGAGADQLRRLDHRVRRDETSPPPDKVVEWDAKREMVKVNPIVRWSQKEVDDYIADQGVLVNPLHYDDYPSIGCATCTIRVEPGDDPRSGRWATARRSAASMHEGGVLVAVAHGSADPRASATIAELAAVARQRSPGLDLRTAFLGHAPPSLPQVLGTIEADREVTVLPLLLTAAYHSKARHPPRAGQDTDLRRVSYGATLGPRPLLLLDALDRPAWPRRCPVPALFPASACTSAQRTAVVLAAAGSSDPEANATIARMAARWQARTGWLAVRPAYASAAEPSPRQPWPACCGTERHASWSPPTCSPRAFSPTGSATALAAGAAAVSPRSAPAPRWPTSCWTDSPKLGSTRRSAAVNRTRKSG